MPAALRIVVRQIHVFAVGRDKNSIGLADFAGGDFYVVIGRDEKHGLEVELARLIPDVTWIGEIDAPFSVDCQIVRAVESLEVIAIGQHADGAICWPADSCGDRNSPSAARVGALTRDKI